ncbi:MAG: hypothetical protein U0Q18_28655 [Bryobacteraceae bacterium]
MVPRSSIAGLILGITLAGATLFAQSAGVTTASMSSSPQFAPVGVAPSETLQVNLSNAATVSGSSDRFSECSGTLTFYDSGGRALGDGTSLGFSVSTGLLSVPLPYLATGGSGQRAMVRVEIKVSPVMPPTAEGPQIPVCTLLSSVEIYDTATGAIHAIVTGNPVHYGVRTGR